MHNESTRAVPVIGRRNVITNKPVAILDYNRHMGGVDRLGLDMSHIMKVPEQYLSEGQVPVIVFLHILYVNYLICGQQSSSYLPFAGVLTYLYRSLYLPFAGFAVLRCHLEVVPESGCPINTSCNVQLQGDLWQRHWIRSHLCEVSDEGNFGNYQVVSYMVRFVVSKLGFLSQALMDSTLTGTNAEGLPVFELVY